MNKDLEPLRTLLSYLGMDKSWMDSFFEQFNFPQTEQDFQVVIQNAEPQQGITVDLVFEKERGQAPYRLESYTAHQLVLPKIDHVDIGSINTAAVEALMKELDWHFDYRILEQQITPIMPDGDWVLFDKYVKAIYNLIMLAVDDAGKEIADILKMKYLKGTPYEERFLLPEVREKFMRKETFYCIAQYPITFAEAVNLLHGRSVRKLLQRPAGGIEATWVRLGNAGDNKKHVPYYTDNELRFPDYDLLAELKKLPIKDKDDLLLSGLLLSMYSGNLVEVPLEIAGKIATYHVEAAPESKGYNLFDSELNSVKASTLPLSSPREQQGKSRRRDNGNRL